MADQMQDQTSSISIHAPREGGDMTAVRHGRRFFNFNPRPPRGGRPSTNAARSVYLYISIHAPREGGDSGVPKKF